MFHLDTIKIDIGRVIDLTGINPIRIHNIYLYGSRIYGNFRNDSDYDFLVTACSMNVHKEFHDGEYNVHIVTPDVFEDRLRDHDIQTMECIYAPGVAKVQIKKDYSASFELRPNQLRKKSLSQSTNAWHQAKIRMNDGDIERGAKSLWHSLRILAFAIQILDEGCIYDFGEGNNWFDEIKESEAFTWGAYKDKWFQLKKDLEIMVKDCKI